MRGCPCVGTWTWPGYWPFMPRSERAEAVERAIEEFDLSPLADGRVDRLSMGQRQRVRVAMAFLHHPSSCSSMSPGRVWTSRAWRC
jgi:ABC-type Mn2+/Zn2+ transport system ATPase subunit